MNKDILMYMVRYKRVSSSNGEKYIIVEDAKEGSTFLKCVSEKVYVEYRNLLRKPALTAEEQAEIFGWEEYIPVRDARPDNDVRISDSDFCVKDLTYIEADGVRYRVNWLDDTHYELLGASELVLAWSIKPVVDDKVFAA